MTPAATASYLWLAIPCLPLVAAVLQSAFLGRAHRGGQGTAVGLSTTAVCFGTFAALLALWYSGVAQGRLDLPGIVGRGLSFDVRPVGLVFAVFATGLWALSAYSSLSYLANGHGHARYYFFFLLSLSGTVGVFLAGDLFTLFVFFELVSLGSYPLVVHEETEEAMSAGRLYLFMGIAGGLILLLGTMWLSGLQGSAVAVGFPLEVHGPLWPWVVSMVLLVLGFGVKAGMYPLHVWLPRAHPVAPSPASALLSGVMIKTGAYGIFQVVRMFTPAGGHGETTAGLTLHSAVAPLVDALPDLGRALGIGLIVVALLTVFLGAFLALVQTNAKRVLAYSSVSQMGYILLGAGMAGVLGNNEAMGAVGFAFHVLNHALFKSAMFMLVGIIYLKTHELDIRRLGGLGRHLPLTALVFAMAVMGISGVPGLNGYASKTLLHDAILIQYHHYPGPAWRLVEVLFVAGGALTFAYTAKLWYFLFWRHPVRFGEGGTPAKQSPGPIRETAADRILAASLGIPMLVIGLRPAIAVSGLASPFALASGFDHAALHHVESVSFFSWETVSGSAISIALGAAVFAVLYVLGFPHPEIRRGPSVEGWVFAPLVRLGTLFCLTATASDRFLDAVFVRLTGVGYSLVAWVTWLEVTAERLAVRAGVGVGRAWVLVADLWYMAWRRLGGLIIRSAKRAGELLPVLDYAPGESDTAREFNLLNLDFDFFLVLAVIAVSLVLMFLTTQVL